MSCKRAVYPSDLPLVELPHIYESSIDVARKLTKTRGYRISQIMRKRVEELFGEAKECMGLRRTKFRGSLFVQEQVLLTAMAQNVKRMVRLLSRTGPKKHPGALAAYPMKVSCNSLSLLCRVTHYFGRAISHLCPTGHPISLVQLVFQQPVKDLTLRAFRTPSLDSPA